MGPQEPEMHVLEGQLVDTASRYASPPVALWATDRDLSVRHPGARRWGRRSVGREAWVSVSILSSCCASDHGSRPLRHGRTANWQTVISTCWPLLMILSILKVTIDDVNCKRRELAVRGWEATMTVVQGVPRQGAEIPTAGHGSAVTL